MAIYVFGLSIVFLFGVAKLKRIGLLSPYGMFVLFQMLYNLVPWAINRLQIPAPPLVQDSSLISCQLLLTASANLAFGLVHLFFYRVVLFPDISRSDVTAARRFFVAVIPLLLAAVVLTYRYGWNAVAANISQGGAAGGIYGLTSYFKQLVVAAYLYYLYRFGLNKWAWYLFFANMVIMAVDGARTTGFPIIVLTLMIWNNRIERKDRRKLYLAFAFGVVAIVGTRALLVGGDSLGAKMAIPVTIEGLMGDYPALQSIHAVQVSRGVDLDYTLGGSYLIDPVLWMLPQQGKTRADHSFFDGWVQSISPVLPEDFAPSGGFYFVSEAIAAFSYAGPFIVAGGYALLLVLMERNKRRWYFLYLAFTVSIGLLFVKMIFGNAFKIFVFQLFFLSLFVIGHRIRLTLARLLRSDADRRRFSLLNHEPQKLMD